jgi:hypothetical protein
MRFATRIMVGAGAVALLAAAAPAADTAATAPTSPEVLIQATTNTATAPYFFDSWGPYFSGNGKAKAQGKVVVEKKSQKQWYWKRDFKVVKECKRHNGETKCRWVKKPYKKHVWKWVHEYHYTVASTLTNYKWSTSPRFRCAWETFRVVNFDGSSYLKSFKNCGKFPASYSFNGKNAEDIYVKVSRGDHGGPKGYSGSWKSVYSHS